MSNRISWGCSQMGSAYNTHKTAMIPSVHPCGLLMLEGYDLDSVCSVSVGCVYWLDGKQENLRH